MPESLPMMNFLHNGFGIILNGSGVDKSQIGAGYILLTLPVVRGTIYGCFLILLEKPIHSKTYEL